MSDEIYVNIGTSFQQPYQGQGLAQGRTPVIAQYIARKPANAQTPFTYQNRQPASARQPSSAQTPYIANRQTPSIVQATANYPYIASAQQPYPYIANAQTTTQNTGRSPVIYNATGRTPFTYARQGQTPYNATGRLPSTYATQGQSPYSFQQSYQQTYERQGQQPYTFNDTGQQPSIYQAQGNQPYSYQQNYQTPTIYTAQVSTDSQAIYQHPTTYQRQAQISYRHPTNSQSVFQTTVQAQISYQHPYTARVPAIAVGRQPTTYTYPDPAIWGPYPVTGGVLSNYIYHYQGFRSSGAGPTQYSSPIGSSPWSSLPDVSPFIQHSWYSFRSPISTGTTTLTLGNFNNTPSALWYGNQFTYVQLVTPAGTTNVPVASMSYNAPSLPTATSFYMTIPANSLSTYTLGSSVTGSIGLY